MHLCARSGRAARYFDLWHNNSGVSKGYVSLCGNSCKGTLAITLPESMRRWVSAGILVLLRTVKPMNDLELEETAFLGGTKVLLCFE